MRHISDLTEYGYRVYINGDCLEVGYENGDLYSFAYINQGVYNPDTGEITELDRSGQFAILGSLLGNMSAGRTNYLMDVYMAVTTEQRHMMAIIIPGNPTFYLHYNLLQDEATLYSERAN